MPQSRTLSTLAIAALLTFVQVSVAQGQGSLHSVVDQIKKETTTQPPPSAERTATSAGTDWRTAKADQLTLSQTRELDKADHIGGLALPSNSHRLWYGKTFGGKSFVVLRDLDTGKVVSSFPVQDRVEALALSPKEDKLLICLGFGGKAALVRDLATQRSIDLNITLPACASEDKPLTWIDDTTVIFDGNILDLDSLERRRAPEHPYPPKKGKEYGAHPHAYYATVGHTGLAICDRQSDYCHQMFPYMEVWRSTKDMLHVVMIDFCNNCHPDYRLASWRLTTRPAPVHEFSVSLPSTVGGNSYQGDKSHFDECVEHGVGFYARVSGPKVNPLTGKTVAADGTDKGTVQLSHAQGDLYRAILVLEKLPIRVGDVIDLVWSADNCEADRSYRADGLAIVLGPAIAN